MVEAVAVHHDQRALRHAAARPDAANAGKFDPRPFAGRGVLDVDRARPRGAGAGRAHGVDQRLVLRLECLHARVEIGGDQRGEVGLELLHPRRDAWSRPFFGSSEGQGDGSRGAAPDPRGELGNADVEAVAGREQRAPVGDLLGGGIDDARVGGGEGAQHRAAVEDVDLVGLALFGHRHVRRIEVERDEGAVAAGPADRQVARHPAAAPGLLDMHDRERPQAGTAGRERGCGIGLVAGCTRRGSDAPGPLQPDLGFGNWQRDHAVAEDGDTRTCRHRRGHRPFGAALAAQEAGEAIASRGDQLRRPGLDDLPGTRRRLDRERVGAEGWLYVAAVLDLFSRRIVGWSMKAERDASLVMDALMMAVWRRGKADALVHHSDQGSQYTSEQFQRLLADHGITCSMSRSGNVWDNSAMESFFSSLKTERTVRKTYRTRDAARADVFDYIERFYNPKRRHSKLGYLSPIQFEARAVLP